MRAMWFLTWKYIKGYRRQCMSALLCAALFLSAFLTVLIYRDNYQYTIELQNIEKYGRNVGVIYHAEPDKALECLAKIEADGSGVVSAYQQLQTVESDPVVYMGYMDERALYLRDISLLQGELPQKEGEIAVEQATCAALGISAQIGEKVSLPLLENGKPVSTEFVLTGILENYVEKWKRSNSTKESVLQPPPGVLTMQKGNDAPLYMHIVCASETVTYCDINGKYEPNYGVISPDEANGKKAANNVMLIPLAVFFYSDHSFRHGIGSRLYD